MEVLGTWAAHLMSEMSLDGLCLLRVPVQQRTASKEGLLLCREGAQYLYDSAENGAALFLVSALAYQLHAVPQVHGTCRKFAAHYDKG